jgi:hypothetical protein
MIVWELIIKGIQNGAWQVVFPLAVLGLIFVYDKDKKKQISTLTEQNKNRENSLMNLIEKNNKEAIAREDKLMEYLDKTNESHANIANTMERLEMRMEFIEKKIDKI